MNGLLIAFIVLLAAWWGYARGLLAIIANVLALLFAYALAWQETPALARWLVDKAWLPGLLAWPVAGLALFLGGSMLFTVAARWLSSLVPEEWHNKGKSAGTMAGVLLGAGLGLLVVWTVGVLQDSWALRSSAPQPASVAGLAEKPAAVERVDNLVRDMSNQAVAAMVKGALGNSPAAVAAAQWARQPLSMSEGLKHLTGKQELQQLFLDPDNYAVLVGGANSDIQRLAPFQALVNDPQVMQFLSVAGLPGATLPQQSQALAGMLSRYAGNFEQLRTTPEFQSLMKDPELKAKLQQGNLLVLLTNDKMRRLADMLVQGKLPDQLPAEQAIEANDYSVGARELSASTPRRESLAKPVPNKPLYRWRDEKGRLHITEDQPPEGIKADVIQL